MLVEQHDTAAIHAALGEFRPADFPFRNFIQRPGVRVFASDAGALVALRGADLMLRADGEPARLAALDDIYNLRFADDAWPDVAARDSWERNEGQRYLFVNTSPVEVWEAGLKVGFTLPPDYTDREPAHLYWWDGAPRLSSEIRHSCRLGRGLELAARLGQGIHYDEDGHYVRAILSEQPSFVVEVEGQPVSWSTIHLNGTMGMIYTPPEHRRRGYARSLTAFAVDHQLASCGFACCHVVGDNTASMEMCAALGATRDNSRVVWRILLWPGN